MVFGNGHNAQFWRQQRIRARGTEAVAAKTHELDDPGYTLLATALKRCHAAATGWESRQYRTATYGCVADNRDLQLPRAMAPTYDFFNGC